MNENSFEWFQRQSDKVRESQNEWPEWMKSTAGYSSATFPVPSGQQLPSQQEGSSGIAELERSRDDWRKVAECRQEELRFASTESASLLARVAELERDRDSWAKMAGYQTSRADAAEAEVERLKGDLQFVERWAVHHGTKQHTTAEEALGIIQHYPGIAAITDSYADGKRPEALNPYAEIERLKADAGRYQWIRVNKVQTAALHEFAHLCGDGTVFDPEYLDDAIDAALSSTTGAPK